jgi:hypothetical protein
MSSFSVDNSRPSSLFRASMALGLSLTLHFYFGISQTSHVRHDTCPPFFKFC